jgi:hypothetical protein
MGAKKLTEPLTAKGCPPAGFAVAHDLQMQASRHNGQAGPEINYSPRKLLTINNLIE